MLAASASGEIFASPSARQVEAAIRSVPSDKGTILVITNYTGDCLHFGMACEKANASGWQKGKVAVITCGDDVAVGSKKGGLVGRRGLPGQLLGMLFSVHNFSHEVVIETRATSTELTEWL